MRKMLFLMLMIPLVVSAQTIIKHTLVSPIDESDSTVYIGSNDNAATIKSKIESAGQRHAVVFPAGSFDLTDAAINLPSYTVLNGILGSTWLKGVGDDGDSLFVSTGDSIVMNGIGVIAAGLGSWFVNHGANVVTLNNCYAEFGTLVVDSSDYWQAYYSYLCPTRAPVITLNAERGAIISGGASFDFKWTKSGYGLLNRKVTTSYGWYFLDRAKSSSFGLQLKATTGTAAITFDSSGALAFESSMIADGGSTYSLYGLDGTPNVGAADASILWIGGYINGDILTQDSASFDICQTKVSGDVRIQGCISHYWTGSSLSDGDTMWFAISPDTAGPLYIDNMDGITARGVFCDSSKVGPYGKNPPVDLHVYVESGYITTSWSGTARDLTINIPGATTNTIVMPSYIQPANTAAGDTLTPICTVTTNSTTLARDVTSSPLNNAKVNVRWKLK